MTSNVLLSVARAGQVLLERRRYFARKRATLGAIMPTARAAATASALCQPGYVIIPDYYPPERCTLLRAEIDRIMAEQSDVVRKDPFDADYRIYGAERASAAIAAYHDDPFLREVGEAYHGGALVNFATLAGRITARAGNLGSGQGWHRDAFHFQFKTMLYLSDVGPANGPFEILAGSHRAFDVFVDTIRGRLDAPPQTRLTEAQIERLTAGRTRRLKTLTAGAGTLIIFDSSTIHRGAPIADGVRYALTNYYYTPEQISPSMIEKFSPFARGPQPVASDA